MKFLAISQRKILGSSLALPANGLGGSRATSSSVAHFALQNTKFGSEKGKVQNPARIFTRLWRASPGHGYFLTRKFRYPDSDRRLLSLKNSMYSFFNPPAGGQKAERGEKRILGASQGRSATARDGVARFFSRKILVTFHSPRKIVCPAESKLVFRIFVKKCSNFVQKTPPIETSSSESVAPRGREAAALRKMVRRFAAKWLAGQKSKTADLSVSYLKTI